jgi:copper(I)-binding protein
MGPPLPCPRRRPARSRAAADRRWTRPWPRAGRWPEGVPRWVDTPPAGSAIYRVRLWLPGDPSRRFPRSLTWVDPRRRPVLACATPVRQSAGDTVLAWLHPLHNGEAFGLPAACWPAWPGLLPLLLMVTGVQLGAQAQTTVAEPWVRGTVPQQKATGLFANITSAKGGKLVSASSPVAGVVEIHEMAMEGTMMKMRALPTGLDLPAGKAVALKPGGYHVMLMDLKQQLKVGETVPVTLVIEGKDGKKETLELKVPVRALNAAAPAAMQHKH